MKFLKNNIVIIIASIIVLGSVLTIILLRNPSPSDGNGDQNLPTQTDETQNQTDSTDTKPDEQSLPDVKKDEPAPDEQTTDQTTTSTTSTVTPQVTSAYESGGKLTARGFVPAIREDGGSCTFKLINPSGTVVSSKVTEGFADVSTTVCPAGVFSVSSLSSGKYSVELSYESTLYAGVSSAYEVEL